MQQGHFLITGGTSGLGYALAQALISAHFSITLLVRDVNQIARHFNNQTQFDGVIHSAGLGYFKGLLEHTPVEILQTYQVNVVHFSMLINQCAPFLTKHASIVGISSQAALATQPYAAHYGGSKAAFNHVLNALRIEQPQWHVLNVNVGPIETPFHAKADPSGRYARKMKK